MSERAGSGWLPGLDLWRLEQRGGQVERSQPPRAREVRTGQPSPGSCGRESRACVEEEEAGSGAERCREE